MRRSPQAHGCETQVVYPAAMPVTALTTIAARLVAQAVRPKLGYRCSVGEVRVAMM